MSAINKMTIRVSTGRRSQSITWRTTGIEGRVNMGTVNGQLLDIPLSNLTTAGLYWTGIVGLVLPELGSL